MRKILLIAVIAIVIVFCGLQNEVNAITLEELLEQGYDLYNINNEMLNFKIYESHGQIVYGEPSTIKSNETAYSFISQKIEWRILGYNVDGNLVYNDLFPDDATSGIDLRDKNWQMIDVQKDSWRKIGNNEFLVKHILESKTINNGEFTYPLAKILEKKARDYETMKMYIEIQVVPSSENMGSFRLVHITN